MSKLYLVFRNVPANQMFVREVETTSDWTYQSVGGNFADCIAEFTDPAEASIYVDEHRENSIEYAVYLTEDGNSYIVKMDCCSGTYQQNQQCCFDQYQKSFDTEIEALRYAVKLEANPTYVLKDMGTVEEFENNFPAIDHSLTNFTVYAVEAVDGGKLGYATGFSGIVNNFDKYDNGEYKFTRVSGDIDFDWYEPVER